MQPLKVMNRRCGMKPLVWVSYGWVVYQGRNVISAQVHLRSYNSCKVQIGIGLLASSSGASRQLINVLNYSCLSMSFTTPNNLPKYIADCAIEEARTVALGPHTLTYENINFTGSIYAEQTPHGMSKVQSGTFAVIDEMPNAHTDDMKVEPMVQNLLKASPLRVTDLVPSQLTMRFYFQQTISNISKILCKHIEGFASYLTCPRLQNIPRRKLPPGYKTRFFPLRASTIEELRYRESSRSWWYLSHPSKSWSGWYGQAGGTYDQWPTNKLPNSLCSIDEEPGPYGLDASRDLSTCIWDFSLDNELDMGSTAYPQRCAEYHEKVRHTSREYSTGREANSAKKDSDALYHWVTDSDLDTDDIELPTDPSTGPLAPPQLRYHPRKHQEKPQLGIYLN